MILSGGMHPDLMKYPEHRMQLYRQARTASATARTAGFRNRTQYCGFISETEHNTAVLFPKQNTIPQFHFGNKTPLHSEASVLFTFIH